MTQTTPETTRCNQDPDITIRGGDIVRSHDFPDHTPNGQSTTYVEGIVVSILRRNHACPFRQEDGTWVEAIFQDCDRYVIRVTGRRIRGNVRLSFPKYVFPPVNGTEAMFGGVCGGVEKV